MRVMTFKKTLGSILISGGFILGNTGCSDQSIIYEDKPKYNLFKDVDEDGKKDILFAIMEGQYSPCYVFYKRNIDKGEYGNPTFLLKTEKNVFEHDIMGIPIEYLYRESDRDRKEYLIELIQKAENSYKK